VAFCGICKQQVHPEHPRSEAVPSTKEAPEERAYQGLGPEGLRRVLKHDHASLRTSYRVLRPPPESAVRLTTVCSSLRHMGGAAICRQMCARAAKGLRGSPPPRCQDFHFRSTASGICRYFAICNPAGVRRTCEDAMPAVSRQRLRSASVNGDSSLCGDRIAERQPTDPRHVCSQRWISWRAEPCRAGQCCRPCVPRS